MQTSLKWDESDDLVTLTIQRETVRNALNGPTMDALENAAKELHEHPNLRGVILTAQGTEVFCAGGDLKWLQNLDTPLDGAKMSQRMHRCLQRLESLSAPIVTVVNGYAIGGGAERASNSLS